MSVDGCQAYIEKGGQMIVKSRRGVERRHRHCKHTATTIRTVFDRELHLCTMHANRVDRGLPINTRSDF